MVRTVEARSGHNLTNGELPESVEVKKAVKLAQTASFGPMAEMLLLDITGTVPSSPRTLPKFLRKFALSPLAKCVAVEQLRRLGLAEALDLQLAGEDEIREKLISGLRNTLSNDEIQARGAVIGYQWKPNMVPSDTSRIKKDLRRSKREADSALEQLAGDNQGL